MSHAPEKPQRLSVEASPEQQAQPARCALATGSEVRTYAAEHDFKFRKPVCPYCGGKLIASANCWEQEPDGSWIASEVQVDCDSEPDIDGPDWEEWWRAHSYDFCDGWRAVADRILAWMKRHARFNLPNAGDVARGGSQHSTQPKT